MESIIIKNFGPITDIEIQEIKPFTIFIGNSGSGKSTIMKVLALFQWIYKMMCIRSYLKYSGIKKSPFKFMFSSYLKNCGMDNYIRSNTEIIYQNNSCTLIYEKGKLSGTNASIPKNELSLEKISFISDKRSLIPDLLENNAQLKKGAFYLNETYEDYLKATEYINLLNIDCLKVKLLLKKTSLGTKHIIQSINVPENYSIKLNESSSGTQNTVPLNAIIEYYSQYYDLVDSMNKAVFSFVLKTDNLQSFKTDTNIGAFPHKRISIFIEEPELSLFPSVQVDLMDYLVNRCFISHNKNYKIHLLLATHSPFIINHLNVLLKRNANNSTSYLKGNDLSVYRVYEGKLQNLMMQNTNSTEWYVNTTDLSETMENIYQEYLSLTK